MLLCARMRRPFIIKNLGSIGLMRVTRTLLIFSKKLMGIENKIMSINSLDGERISGEDNVHREAVSFLGVNNISGRVSQ